jgi:hypothetical protein
LQNWLWGKVVKLPMAAGEYQLAVMYDPALERGVTGGGVRMLHRWESPAVRFTVRGDALSDPEEVLKVVEQNSGVKFLLPDAMDEAHTDRQVRAWSVLRAFGDSRLIPLFEKAGLRTDVLRKFSETK